MARHRRPVILLTLLIAAACDRDVAAPAAVASLRFAAQPANAVAGQSQSVAVELIAADGSVATGSVDSVQLEAVGGGENVDVFITRAVNGVAQFPALTITRAAGAYQLVATAANVSATSNAFAITPAALSAGASSVRFSPEHPTPGTTTLVTFTFRDQYANALGLAPVGISASAAGATVSPSSGITDGTGSFETTLQSAAGSVALTAAVSGTTVALPSSVAFSPATSLRVVVAPPASITAAQPFSMSVEILNALGNRVDGARDVISLALSGGETLLGRVSANSIGGLATFSDLSVLRAGTAFAITASGAGLTSATPPFVVRNAAPSAARSKVRFASAIVANLATDATFTFRDAYDNPVASAPVTITSTTVGATFTPSSGTTDATGGFVTSFRSPVPGPTPISASVAGAQWTFDPPADALPAHTIVTDSVGQIGFAGARLASTVVQNGTPYTTWFEWSTTSSFSSVVRSDVQTGPNVNCPVGSPCSYAASATSLVPNTSYFFRSALSDALGTIHGETRAFTTLKGGSAPVIRSLTQVNDSVFPGPCANSGRERILSFEYTDVEGDVVPNASSLALWNVGSIPPIMGRVYEVNTWKLDSFEGDGKSGRVQGRYCPTIAANLNLTITDASGNATFVVK